MSSAIQAYGLERLSRFERLQVIGELWDSIAEQVEQIPLCESHREEVDRRWTAFLANPDSAIAWEVVEADATSRLQK